MSKLYSLIFIFIRRIISMNKYKYIHRMPNFKEMYGKAFSEEEKGKIKENIMNTAIELFHNNGLKSLSISELTKSVGIAQGSFYNFEG